MSIFLFLVFGLVVGAIARFLVPGHEPGGWFTSMMIGVFGSFVAGFLGQTLGFYPHGAGATLVASLLGAVLLTVAYHAVVSGRSAV